MQCLFNDFSCKYYVCQVFRQGSFRKKPMQCLLWFGLKIGILYLTTKYPSIYHIHSKPTFNSLDRHRLLLESIWRISIILRIIFFQFVIDIGVNDPISKRFFQNPIITMTFIGSFMKAYMYQRSASIQARLLFDEIRFINVHIKTDLIVHFI